MRCEQLTLCNYCNHEYKVFEFGTGVIGIIGQNGSGKSNIFAALRLALTGGNSNAGNKVLNVYAKAAKSASSYVELQFSHGAVSGVVRRNIRPATPTATLRLNNGEVIEGDTKVTARIEQILGITADVINDIVIVEQEAIFGFLSAQSAKRLEQFQRLFGTDNAIDIHKRICEHMKGVHMPTSCGSIDALRQALTESETRQVAIAAQVDAYQPAEALIQQLTEIATTQSRIREAMQYDQRINTLSTTVTSIESSLVNLTNMLAQQRRSLETTRAEYEKLRVAADKAKFDIASADAAERNRQYRASLTTAVEQATARLNAVTASAPVAPANLLTDTAQAEMSIGQLSADVAAMSRFIASFSAGVTECPTCHTAVTSLSDKLAESKTQLPLKQAKLAELTAGVKATNLYNAVVAKHRTSVTYATSELQQAVNNLTQHAEVTDSPYDVATAQAVVSAAMIAEGQLQKAMESTTRLEAEVTAHTRQLDVSKQQLATEVAAYANFKQQSPPAVTDMLALSSKDTELRTALANRQQAELSLATVNIEIDNLKQRIADEETIASKAVQTQQWLNHVTEMRDMFARDAAPRFVSQTNLQRLEASINDVLTSFTAPFRVAATEGLSFIATFAAGYQQPAERLSPGQKVLLALAFRLSLNLMFANNIGAMYLDEPTAWMDKQRIQGFGPVLGQLREFAASRGLQTIIITHESDLAPLFDTTISL